MASRADLEAGIVAADKAGDSEGVKILGAELLRLQGQEAPPEGPIGNAKPSVEGMSARERFAAGAQAQLANIPLGFRQRNAEVSDLAANLSRGVGNGQQSAWPETDKIHQEIAEKRAMDAPLLGDPAGRTGGFIGGALPYAAAAPIPGANSAAGGALLGTLSGILQPTAEGESLPLNMAGGAIAGATAPVFGAGYSAAKQLARPYTERGQGEILGKLLNERVGDNDILKTLLNLDNAKTLVPGSNPTAAEAGGSAGLAALQRAAAAAEPQAYAKREAEQTAARRMALSGIAGTPESLSADMAKRANLTKPLYEAAKATNVLPDAEFADMAKRPLMQDAIQEALTLLKNRGVDPAQASHGQFYQALKFTLDDAITGERIGMKKLSKETINAAKDLRGQFISWMDKNIPEMAKANKAYEQLSAPVNQKQVGKALYDKFVPPLADFGSGITVGERTDALAGALRNSEQLVKGATGLEGKTVENVLTPEQFAKVNALMQDLERSKFADTAGKGVGSDTTQKLAMSAHMDRAGMPTWLKFITPTRIQNVAAAALDKSSESAEKKMRLRLAQALLDPKEAAVLMRAGIPQQLTTGQAQKRALAKALLTALPISAEQGE